MFNRHAFSPTPLAIALVLGPLAVPFLWAPPAQSRPPLPSTFRVQAASGVVTAGTPIPVSANENNKITIGPNESRSLTLTVAAPIRDPYGNLVIPAGSRIQGQLQPAGDGIQFVASQIQIGNQWQSLNAVSDIVTTTETVKQGATTADILKGTAAGAGTATIIAGTTGDRHIDALEVLGGAAFGALAGWALPTAGIAGGGTQEVIVIYPNRDLTLILQSDLDLGGQPSISFRRPLRSAAPGKRQNFLQFDPRNVTYRLY
jgi:hypothetical protein